MSNDAPLIMHVVHRFDVGGLENGVVNLINRMAVNKWRHVVLSLTQVSQEFAKRIQRDDVKLLELGKGPGHLLRWYPRIQRIIKEIQPSIVHTRNLAALEATVPAWLAGVPVRIHGEHGWDASDPRGLRRKYQWIRRAYRPFVHRYIALSKDIEQYLVDRVRIAPDAISQIYNGVDILRFQSPRTARARVADCPFMDPGLWLVGTVGRLEEVKDQVNLAQAFVRATELDPEGARRLRLVIVGDGTLRGKVASVLARAGLLERAWFAGSRADVPELMASLDCFVLPSLSEGISNTILEAMATGLAVVATTVGGNAELIEDGLTGTLVPPANSEMLARAVLRYLKEPAVARRHARTAQRVAIERFSLDRMVADYSELYEKSLYQIEAKRRPASADARQSSSQ